MAHESGTPEREWNDVDLKPLGGYPIEQIVEFVGPTIHELVSKEDTQRRLHALGLSREIGRHAVSVNTSTHELLADWHSMREGERETFVVTRPDVDGKNALIGLAYRLPRQRLPALPSEASPKPTVIRLPATSPQATDLTSRRGTLVSAWTPPGFDLGMLEHAYRHLRTGNASLVWALTPPPPPDDRSHMGDIFEILMDSAGYEFRGTGPFRDPMEPGEVKPPLRALYVASGEQ